MANTSDQCVVVGLSGLSLALLHTKLRDGKLPALAAIIEGGELRPMVSPVPARSPAAWASLSTGMGPGSHGFVLHDEIGPSGLRPAGYATWRCAPFWELLAQAGIKTASVNWPGTIPGARWNGTHIDARLGVASGLTGDDWPLPLDIAPACLREELRALRVHPTDISREMLGPLGGQQSPAIEARCAVAMAQLATVQAAADAVWRAGPWNLVAVNQDWLLNAANALDCTIDALPDPVWALLDHSLAMVIKQASDSSLVMIASIATDGPGLLFMRGTGVRPDRLGQAVSTLSAVPTIFAHFGFSSPELAIGLGCFRPSLRPLPPFEPRIPIPDPDPSDLARISEFGHHLGPPDETWRVRRLLAEAELLLAEDPKRAAALAEDALAIDARSLAALGILASSLVTLDDGSRLPEIARQMEAVAPDHLWAHLVRGTYHAMNGDEAAARPYLRRVAADGNVEERLRVGAAWLILSRRTEAAGIFRAILAIQPGHFGALVGLLSTETVRGREAEQLLHRVLAIDPTHASARAALESLLRSLGRSAEAANLAAAIER